jgi:ribosomal protein L5
MLKETYIKKIAPTLKKKLNISNVMNIPKVDKVVLSM